MGALTVERAFQAILRNGQQSRGFGVGGTPALESCLASVEVKTVMGRKVAMTNMRQILINRRDALRKVWRGYELAERNALGLER